MDDYVHCFMAYMTALPQQTLASPAVATAVSHTLAALHCPASETILICLDTLNLLAQRMQHAEFQASLQPVFAQSAKPILSLVLAGIVDGYPEHGFDMVPVILQATVVAVPPAEAQTFATEALAGIPGHALPPADKQQFIVDLQS